MQHSRKSATDVEKCARLNRKSDRNETDNGKKMSGSKKKVNTIQEEENSDEEYTVSVLVDTSESVNA